MREDCGERAPWSCGHTAMQLGAQRNFLGWSSMEQETSNSSETGTKNGTGYHFNPWLSQLRQQRSYCYLSCCSVDNIGDMFACINGWFKHTWEWHLSRAFLNVLAWMGMGEHCKSLSGKSTKPSLPGILVSIYFGKHCWRKRNVALNGWKNFIVFSGSHKYVASTNYLNSIPAMSLNWI